MLSTDSEDKKKSKHAFLILSDCFSEALLSLYRQVSASAHVFGQTFILYHNKGSVPEKKLYGCDTFIFTDLILSELGYTPVRNTLVPGSNHFPLLKFYLENPDYDYYWCIEDDIVFNGIWSSFFNKIIKNIEYDFISSFIAHRKEQINPDWVWWRSLSKIDVQINQDNLLMSFNPIYSISNKAARFLDQSLKSGWIGHHEVLIATLLFENKFQIKDFGGTGRFVPDGFNEKFYTDDTHLWRPSFSSPGALLNKIYHPVKTSYKITADFKYKISFCISGVKMLDDLKQTLINNIEGNSDYENFEFVILEHFESDADSWFQQSLHNYIESGKLVCYKFCQNQHFNISYAKNVVFKLASGEILCFINPNQLTGIGLAAKINEQFKLKTDIAIILESLSTYQSASYNITSKNLCVKKTDLLLINGFDENLEHDDSENLNILTRLTQINIKSIYSNINNLDINRNLGQTLIDNYLKPDLIFIQHLDSTTSKVIFMYPSGIFEIGTLTDNATRGHSDPRYSYLKRTVKKKYTLMRQGWTCGSWRLSDNDVDIIFLTNLGKEFTLFAQDKFYLMYTNRNHVKFYNLTDTIQKKDLENTRNQLNYSKSHHIITSKKRRPPDQTNFGTALVYCNFKRDFPIIVT